MTATVMSNYAKAILHKEQHLAVPSVCAKGPAVRKGYDRTFTPVLIVDFSPILGNDCANTTLSLLSLHLGLIRRSHLGVLQVTHG